MKSFKPLTAAALIFSLAVIPCVPVSADAAPVVTLGADLTAEQKNKIMSFFGTDENSVSVIEVNNQQERKYLEGLVSNDIIGIRTLSCAYILPTNSGGIIVKTANLTWVTDAMLANSLLTCGVENCQVIATAPFEVSGTGALTGVMLAYETSSGETLEETKKELATEELVFTGELIDEIGQDPQLTEIIENETGAETADSVEISKYVIDMLNEMKTEALNGELSEESAKKIVETYLNEYKIDLSEEMKQKLIDYVKSFSLEKYETSFTKALDNLTDRIKDGFDININANLKISADESVTKFEQLFKNLINWLRYIFGDVTEQAQNAANNIFQNVNTDIINFDEDIDIEGALSGFVSDKMNVLDEMEKSVNDVLGEETPGESNEQQDGAEQEAPDGAADENNTAAEENNEEE